MEEMKDAEVLSGNLPPKRPPTAFAIYAETLREVMSQAYPSFSRGQISKLLGMEWAMLGAEQQMEFQKQARLQLQDYKRKKKLYLDQQPPKRAPSAFFLFSAARRGPLRAEKPDLAMKDIAKMLGAEWRGMSDSEKLPFEKKAKKFKRVYLARKAAWDARRALHGL